MATTLKQTEQASAVTLLSTELNSLANGSNAVSSTAILNNAIGQANTDGYVRGKLELNIGAPAAALTLNTGVTVWFLQTVDGTNYEDGDASTTPARLPHIVIPVRAVATAQRIIQRIAVPVGTQKVLVSNGTGQSWNASGNSLKLILNTDSSV